MDIFLVEYLDVDRGGVARAIGALGAVVDESGRVKEVVVESDGGATFVPLAKVIKVIKVDYS